MEDLRNSLFNINCPSCGASMELVDNYVFECKYCNRKMYVYPDTKVKIMGVRRLISNDTLEFLSKHTDNGTERFLDDVKKDMALQISKTLLENGELSISMKESLMQHDCKELLMGLKYIKAR